MVVYRFADCVLDPQRQEMTRGGEPVALEPQVLALLVFLIENRDRVVSRDDILDTVWDGRIVSDATLSSRISAARSAAGDSGETQSVIRTIPRRGFRFVADVTSDDTTGATNGGGERPSATTHTIRYCATPGGTQLAWSTAGAGPPLVKVANWLNHLEFDWTSPIMGDLFQEFASYRTLVRYDSRGIGLSDREADDLSFAAMVEDFETVVDAASLPPFALLGISQGAGIAIDYAVRHPDRVTHLVLWGGFARGRRRRGSDEEVAQSEAFETLMRQGWGKETSAFRHMFASLYLPEATDAQIRCWTELQRLATSPETAIRLRQEIDQIDVSELLPQVSTPTLILHSQREEVAPVAEAKFMAARIPDAHFVALDSANHLAMPQEPAWRRAVDEIRAFLDG